MEPILRIDNLTHTYSAGTPFERNAVDHMSLDIMPGEFLGIIGHTGSGKSTMIQHLNGTNWRNQCHSHGWTILTICLCPILYRGQGEY